MKELPKIQLAILKNVSRYLKKGGELLYSTCTILPEENENVVRAFLESNGDFEEVREYLEIPSVKSEYGITLLPSVSKTDGFYMCKLRRVR